jgi:hypothetical protein
VKKKVVLTITLLWAIAIQPVRAYAQQNSEAGASPQPPALTDFTAPAPPGAVPAGTRFVIEMEDPLDTKEDHAGKQFTARLINPLTTGDGRALPAGAILHGHVDKSESAHQVGRARLWLTFDTIATPHGRLPIVAQLIDAPGVHSVHVAYDREGEITATSSKRSDAELAAAAAALTGAAAGVASKNARDAATGAAIAAVTAFLITSGLGQEISLPPQTKFEVVLTRPLLLYTE